MNIPTTELPAATLQLQEATDTDLRQLVFSNDYVLVKFVDDNCTICQALAPKLTALANDPHFAHVLFLRLNADSNPVASKEIGFTQAPFFAAYRNARLVHCETVYTEQHIKDILVTYLALT